MPTPQTILEQLAAATNGAVAIAALWHVATAIALGALLRGWRPSNRAAAVMLAGPLASAAGVAFALGNRFNGSILGALAVLLLLLGLRFTSGAVARGPASTTVAGLLLIGFGSFYPHFLQGRSALAFLYAAPTGVIPCPTLSLVIGFGLLAKVVALVRRHAQVVSLFVANGMREMMRSH